MQLTVRVICLRCNSQKNFSYFFFDFCEHGCQKVFGCLQKLFGTMNADEKLQRSSRNRFT